MLTTENAIQTIQRFKIDDLGRLYCLNCIGYGHGGEPETTEPKSNSKIQADETCDGCWKPRADWPTSEIHCTVQVEHFTCKIY